MKIGLPVPWEGYFLYKFTYNVTRQEGENA